MDIQTISPIEVFIVTAVYITVIMIGQFIAKYTNQTNNFFNIFTQNTMSIIFLYLLLIITTAIALSVVPFLTLIAVPIVFLIGVLALAFKLGQKSISIPVAIIITLLLITLTVPVILSLVYGDDMNVEAKISSLVLVGVFWLAGCLFTLLKPFSQQVMPKSLTRPLLCFILLTFIVIMNAGGSWGAIPVFILTLVIGFIWWFKSNDKVLSVSINTYQKSPTEIATAVVSLVFLSITTFVFLLRKPKKPKLDGEVTSSTYVSPSTSIVSFSIFGLMCTFVVYIIISTITVIVTRNNKTKKGSIEWSINEA